MARTAKRVAIDETFASVRDDLAKFGRSIGQGGADKVHGTDIGEEDKAELKEGLEYLLLGLEAFLDDTQALYMSQDTDHLLLTRITGHTRALIGGALFVGKHMGTTESAERLMRGKQTASARKGRSRKHDERLAIATPILNEAARKPNGRLLNPGRECERVNVALATQVDAEGRSIYKPISPKTLERYAAKVGQSRTH